MTFTKRDFLAATAAGFCLSAALPASAHRAARTETEVTLYEDGRIDIIHLMHTDDTQRALYETGLLEKPDLLSLKARAKAALYVSEHFAIFANDKAIELELIGAEIEGHNYYIYQQGRTNASLEQLAIEASMLRELIDTQTNSVNIKANRQTYSLDFKNRDGRKTIVS